MIILDLNQVMISNLMMQLNHNPEVDEDLVRHMILNSIRLYKTKFSADYGELVIACDDKNYWRKSVFPYYKAHRKEDRAKSTHDWNRIFEVLNKIRDEIRDNFPYKVIQVDRAEADDIIGVLTAHKGTYLMNDDTERVLILSGDKDFGQLQKYMNVDQFSPVLKKWIKVPDARRFLREHIMKGDRGDGIPNFLSNDSCIINKERQKPLATKKLDLWVDQEPEMYCDERMLRNYKRNEQLVDLEQVPDEIADAILEQYRGYKVPKKSGLLNYFIKNKLKNLMDSIGEF
jgi:acetone carboxylase gamma subunit